VALQNKKIDNVKGAMKAIIGIYCKRGFQVRSAMMDGGFETLRGPLADLQVELNLTGRDEHVQKFERYVRTVKERCKAVYSTVPFSRLSPILIIETVNTAVVWLNAFPIS
jgi:hypothetical protein